ncbi:FtsW/RodA/SpoVE family cell cycle protein [Jatrophihabitans sp. YIM 134969]
MLLFAVALVVFAEGIVEATRFGHVSSRIVSYGAVPLVLGLVAHLLIRKVAPYADPLLLPLVVFLNGLGLVMIHRIDLGLAVQAQSNGVEFDGGSAGAQVVWTAIGLVVLLAVLLIVRDHRVLERYAYTLALVGLFFLILPIVLPAQFSEVNGARIWIRVAGFSIQPGEFARLALAIFASAYLVSKRDVLSLAGRRVLGLDLPRGRDLGPLLVAWLLAIAVLVRGRDLGTSLMFFGLFIVLLYVATSRVSWVVIGFLLFGAGAYAAYRLFSNVQLRVDVWLDPFAQRAGDPGYQLSQSLFGLGTGGLFGAGLGGGHPEIVPLAQTDFIISSFGEEIGLVGLAALLMVYALIVARGLAIGTASRDSFGKLLAVGLSFSMGLQVFIVVAGVSRLLPETGLTAPFLSYGGSSLVANYAILALLLRISDAARRPGDAPPPPPPPQTGGTEDTASQPAVTA